MVLCASYPILPQLSASFCSMGRILKLIYKLQDHFYKKYFYLKVVWLIVVCSTTPRQQTEFLFSKYFPLYSTSTNGLYEPASIFKTIRLRNSLFPHQVQYSILSKISPCIAVYGNI